MSASTAYAATMTGVCRAAVLVISGSLWLWSDAAVAADAVAGRAKAQACAVCHGAVGLSTQPDAPNLAGQPAVFLSTQLRAYRSGERRHEVMNIMAKTLSDDDIDNLAAWFSSVRVDAHAPP
jgi:cytochrome c553